MADISKISPDDGSTILNVKDRNAVHWSESQGYVGKNLLKNTRTSFNTSGLTITVNADKSVTVNGTATANTDILIHQYTKDDYIKTFGAGNTVIMTGCPQGGSDTTYNMRVHADPWADVHDDNGNGVTFTIPSSSSATKYYVWVRVRNGIVCNNLTFKPMIRLSSISDSTYEPYLTPNTEIDNKLSYADNAVLGAKNLLNNTATTQTINGVTFTVNEDKSVTVDGTATGSITNYYMNNYTNADFPFDISNEYILSGCPTGGSSNSYRLDVIGESGISYGAEDTGNGIKFQFSKVPTGNEKFSVRIRIGNGTVCNNLVFKPMIRIATDTDNTYAPYAMTNKELTEHVKPIIKTGWNSEFTITVDGAGSGTTLALVVSVLGIGVIGFSGGKLNYATIWAASSQSITASEASATSIKLTTSSTTTVGLIPLTPISGKWSIT